MMQQEQESLINQENNISEPPQELSQEAKKKLRKIRRASALVALSCVARIATAAFFFNWIPFLIDFSISLLGLIAIKKKKTCLLSAYGIISIIQGLASIGLIVYFSTQQINFPFWVMAFVGTTIALVLLGGMMALKMKYQIAAYERVHGAIPRCSSSRRCNSTQATEQVQPTEESTSVNNSDFVMIPMQNVNQPQQHQTQVPLVYVMPQMNNQQPQFVQYPFVPQPYVPQQQQQVQQQQHESLYPQIP